MQTIPAFNMFMRKYKGYLIFLILGLFFIIQIFGTFTKADIWWDPAVYIEMGKSIYSDGKVGLWEPYRPILWPLILGGFWAIELNPILFGNIATIIIAAGCIYVVYLLTKKLFNIDTALIASAMLAFTPTFFLFSGMPFTEMASLFFLLMGLFFYFRRDHFWSGIFFGLSFVTRVFYAFVFAALIGIMVFIAFKKRGQMKAIFFAVLGFFIPLAGYLLSNIIMYKDAFYPFYEQTWMTIYVGWVWTEPFYFYFLQMLKENLLSVIALAGIFLILINKKREQNVLLIMFLLIFIPFTIFKQKEVRFMVLFWPFICILIAVGIKYLLKFFEKNKFGYWCLAIIILGSFVFYTIPQLKFNQYQDEYDIFYNYEKNNKLNEPIWVSNPSYIVHTDYTAGLIYYPRFDISKMKSLETDMADAKTVLINTCDIPCPPDESGCEEKKVLFIDNLKKRFVLKEYDKKWICEFMVLTSP